MTEAEARELARHYKGISVEWRLRGWCFCARFSGGNGFWKRGAGQSLEKALRIREELVAEHSKQLKKRKGKMANERIPGCSVDSPGVYAPDRIAFVGRLGVDDE